MKTRFLALAAIVCVGVLAGAAAVQAAPTPGKVHIQLWPEYDDTQVLLLEVVEYPASVRYPISAKAAVPKGVKIEWVGQVTGSGTSSDVEATYRVNPKKDYDEVAFTLTKSRIGQIEARWSGLRPNGSDRTIVFPWVQRYPAGKIDFGVKAPSRSSNVRMNLPVAYSNKDELGLVSYGSAPISLAVGRGKDFTVSYRRDASGPSVDAKGRLSAGTASTGTSGNDVSLALFIAIVAGVVIAVIIYTKTRAT